jgi:hypothetical protein
MTLAHLPPHPLQHFGGYTLGFASAPDGFVFLSGLVSAWVYLRIRAKHGQKALEVKALYRFRDVYLTHVGLLFITIVENVFLNTTSFRSSHPLQALIAGCLLVYQPHTSDILPMYCIFLLFLPLLLEQFVHGKGRRVLLISLLLWLISLRGIGDPNYVVPYIDLGAFNIFTWQAYFIAGTYFGYRGVYGQGPLLPRSRRLLAACILVSLALFVQRHFAIVPVISLFKFHLSPDHNPLRFLNAISLGHIVWIVPREMDVKLMRVRLCRFFNYLGKHSLQVFAWSLPVTNFLSYFHVYLWDGPSPLAKLVAALLTIASLGIPAVLHERHRQRGASGARTLEYAATTGS